MTVRELIFRLKRLPQDAQVGWRAHDQSEDELDGYVRCVEEANDKIKEEKGVGVILGP
jgi:hypothetical protein